MTIAPTIQLSKLNYLVAPSPSYDKEDVKRVADCGDIMRVVLNAREYAPGRFSCPWREGSDSGSVRVERDQWYDHVAKEGGDVIELIQRGKEMTFREAVNWLGEYYRLAPAPAPMPTAKRATTPGRIVKEYIYTDADGRPIHKKIRYDPKEFRQQSLVNGKWKWGMNGVTPVLYRLPEVIAAIKADAWIFQVEGEKDADNLVALGLAATTQTNGAGKWNASYSDTLQGARVAIIADKDDPGRNHAEMVAEALAGKAAVVKVLELPGEDVKDASDWIEAGGNADTLLAMVEAAEPWFKKPTTTDPAVLAKELNLKPFSNYTLQDTIGENGKMEHTKIPRLLRDLRAEVFNRNMGFPCRVGSELFVADGGQIRYLQDRTALFAWLQAATGQRIDWATMAGAVGRDELFADLQANAREYSLIASVPTWPRRDDVYCTCGSLPEPTPDRRHLEEFLSLFNPADDASVAMLRAFVASPLYFETAVDRPLFVIDSNHGQGSGKTKLVEMIARLYGTGTEDSEPFNVDIKAINCEGDRVWRRLLSPSGRRKRIVLIDNVTGFVNSSSLAALTTQNSISGMAPYARGEQTRLNDLTYVITSNSARLDRDLASRAVFIRVARPQRPDPLWAKKTAEYIDLHRFNIVSEIIATLERGAAESVNTKTRFRAWEARVMAPMVGNETRRLEAIAANERMQAESDYDLENAETAREFFTRKIASQYGANARVFLPSKILAEWLNQALPDEHFSSKAIPQILKNWAKAGMMPELNFAVSRYGGDGQRGMAWNFEIRGRGDWDGIPIFSDPILPKC